jgi:hypothetical protein
VFNMVRITSTAVEVQHFGWNTESTRFTPTDRSAFARTARDPVVSAAGGDDPDARG